MHSLIKPARSKSSVNFKILHGARRAEKKDSPEEIRRSVVVTTQLVTPILNSIRGITPLRGVFIPPGGR